MATIKPLRGAAATYAPGTSIQSVANGGAWQTNAFDDSTALSIDQEVMVKIKTGASGVSASGVVWIYAAGSLDGTTWPDTVTGTEGTLTLVNPTNLNLIGRINAVANATTYTSVPCSVASAFGNTVPQRWSLVLVNATGAAWDGTAASFSIISQQYQYQII